MMKSKGAGEFAVSSAVINRARLGDCLDGGSGVLRENDHALLGRARRFWGSVARYGPRSVARCGARNTTRTTERKPVQKTPAIEGALAGVIRCDYWLFVVSASRYGPRSVARS